MRRLRLLVLALSVCSGLLLAGCGDDGGGDEQAFCELLSSEDEYDIDTPEGQEALKDALETAPDEIKGDMETIVDAFEELEGLDEDDPEAFGAAFGLVFDPEMLAAMANIEEYGVDNCGLEAGFMTGEQPAGDTEE